MRNVRPETTSQKIAWAPCEETAPSVSSATIAATVKNTRSQRKSDLRSLRFSARTSADVFMTANAYPPACVLAHRLSLRANVNLLQPVVKGRLAVGARIYSAGVPAEYDAIIVGGGHN